jgi:diguanylate cyclase (GGDEF)-like protein
MQKLAHFGRKKFDIMNSNGGEDVMKTINSRYKLLSKLNSTYYYEVYHAEDMSVGRKVELVLLIPEISSSTVVEEMIRKNHYYTSYRMKDLCRVHDIDVIRQVDDSTRYQLQYFYTREPYLSLEVVEYLNLSREEIIGVTIDLLRVVRRFHQSGQLIGLLNFEHFQIVADNEMKRIVIIDPITLELKRNLFFEQEESTSQFLAPEAVYDNAATIFSDYYSLAKIVFYIFYQVDYHEINFKTEFTKFASNELTSLIIQMVSNLESERQGAFQRIYNKLYNMDIRDHIYQDRLSHEYINLEPEYYDKNANLSNLRDAVIKRYNYESHYNGFLITGMTGTGKSRMMKELHRYLILRKVNVLWIDVKKPVDEPFNILKQIIRKLNLEKQLLPDTNLQINTTKQNSDSEILRTSNRLMNALLDQIKFKPVVVLIDGSEKIHANEIKMINYYLSSNHTNPMTFVLAEGIIGREESFNKEGMGNKIYQVELVGFDYIETSQIMKSIMGISSNIDKLIASIMEETEGNPRSIIEEIRKRLVEGTLYVNSDFEWFEKTENRIIGLSGGVESEKILTEIEELSETDQQILQLVAIFDFAIAVEYIKNILRISRDDIGAAILRLIKIGMVTEKIGDHGFIYELVDRPTRLIVRNHIPYKQYIEFNELAAEQIRDFTTDSNYQMNQHLIYHYRESRQFDRALNLSLKIAEDMGRAHLITQQIKYYELAIEINSSREKELENIHLYRKLSEIHMQRGNNQRAIELIDRSVSFAEGLRQRSVYIDSMYVKLKLMLNFNQISEVEEIVDSMLMDFDIEHLNEGYFKISMIKSKVLYNKNCIKELLSFSKKLMNQATEMDYREYIAQFCNEYGIALTQSGNFEDAIEYYQKSYEIFMEIGNQVEASRPLNNIGVEYVESIGDLRKAREYYLKGLYAVENLDDSYERIIYLSNIGETYLLEDDYPNALRYLQRAETIVKISHHSNFGFNVYLILFNIYMAMNRYDIAFGYFNKLENEIIQSSDRGAELGAFYYSSVEAFIKMFDFIKAENYLLKLNQLKGNESQKERNIYHEILRYKIVVFKSQLFNRDPLGGIELIKTLKDHVLNHMECMVLRRLIIETIQQLFYSNKITEIQYLIDLDDELSNKFDNPYFGLKRRIVLGILESDRVTYYLKFIDEIELPEDRWMVFNLLGREYLYANQLFPAFNYLFKALDEIKLLMKLMPLEYREKYIFYDTQKVELRNFIVNIMAKILGQYVLDDEKIYHEFSIEEVDPFFQFKYYQEIVSYDLVTKSEAKIKEQTYFSTINDLINAFEYNEYDNIHLILKYLKQYCFADFSAVYIFDMNNNVTEVIGEGDSKNQEIGRILRNFYGTEGILINEFLKIGNSNYLSKDVSALILIPLKAERRMGINRREFKGGQSSYSSYLYLSVSQPFNNFTDRTFEEISKLNRFIYQYVEKYFLNSFFTIDKTTGVFMRSHIEECIHQEIYYSKMTDRKFVIAMGDIDKFKDVNDAFGHQKGDDVLRTIGEIIKNTLRETDIVGRYGGEEFILFLPNTNRNDAVDVVERVREDIENYHFSGLNRKITMSFGISGYPDHSETLEELIEKADQALYVSKSSGRNQVTLWDTKINDIHQGFNSMAGIFTGTDIINTRSVKGIIHLINILRLENHQEKRENMIDVIMEMTGARYCTLVYPDLTYLSRDIGDETFTQNNLFDQFLINDYNDSHEGDYFVDWRNFTEINPDTKKMSWRSIIVIPIISAKIQKATLLLGVPVYEKEFEHADYNLLNRIAPLIGSIL